MKKKKVLVHGTAESLEKFFSDAVSRDYEIVAILSEEPENFSVADDDKEIEIFAPHELPRFVFDLVDGIILTDVAENKSVLKYFLKQKIEPRKIFLWEATQGWGTLNLPDKDGAQVVYVCGLEFHLRDEDDETFFQEAYHQIQNQW